MSERAHVVPTPEGEFFEPNRFANVSIISAIVAIIGLVLAGIGAVIAPEQFAFSWLFGFGFYFTICAGCFFWIIVHHAVDAEWSVVVRRQLENVAMLLPVVALAFIPIIIFRQHLFEWMTIPHGHDPNLDSKRLYLNLPFWLIRALIFFGYFTLVAWLFRSLSIAQDKDGDPAKTLRMRRLSFIALPLFALSLTFGAYDWLAGLNYKWFSTMWGVYIFAGAAGSSMSFLVILVTLLRRAGYLQGTITLEHYHFMGKWMLTFSVFWAYIGFAQYMLIWYANIPEETEFFILRNTEAWNLMSLLLVIGRFFIPFAILLVRSPKKHPSQLMKIAIWIVFMQLLDIYIVVMPELHRTSVHVSLFDFAPLLAIGGVLVFVYLKIVPKSSLFPVRDPRLIESLRIVN